MVKEAVKGGEWVVISVNQLITAVRSNPEDGIGLSCRGPGENRTRESRVRVRMKRKKTSRV